MSPKSKKEEEFDFEKSVKRLEEIVENLENEDLPLKKALALFVEGKKISKKCGEELCKLELTVQKIIDEEDKEIVLEDFIQYNEEENES